MIALVVGIAVFHASAAGAWGQSRPVPPPSTQAAMPAKESAQPPAYPPAPGAAPAAAPAAANAGETAAGAQVAPSYIPPPPFVPQLRPLGPIVHLRTDNPRARLQHLTLRWVDVCTSPCAQPVDPAGQYRVGGGAIKSSSAFQLPPGARSVQISASTGSVVWYWIGAGLAINGVASLALAGLFLAGPTDNTNTYDDYAAMRARDDRHSLGLLYLVFGLVSMAIGLPFMLANNTTVEVR